MKLKIFFIVFNFLFLSMAAGCELLPEPSSLIRPPQYSQAMADNEEDIKMIAKSFLPQGTRFLYPVHPIGADAVQALDIEGDGQNEILVTYKGNEACSSSGAIVLKKMDGKWQEIWHDKSMFNIAGLDWSQFIDITDDKVPELLLGWNLGFEVGCNLDITSFKDTPEKVYSIKYNEMEIVNISGSENERKPEIVLTRKEADQKEDNIPPLVLRWHEGGLVPAIDAYSIYYKDKIDVLKEKTKLYDNNFMDWYDLSEMLVRSNRSGEAVEVVDKALKIIPSQFEKYRIKLEIYKAEVWIQQGKFNEARILLNNIKFINGTRKVNCTKDELALIHMDLGRAYLGLKEYKDAQIEYKESLNIIKSTYVEGSELFMLNSYTVKKELDQLNALAKILNY